MIYLILDAYYHDVDGKTTANVSAIRFTGIENNIILNEYKAVIHNVSPYKSGQFYKREMPCLLGLIDKINDPFDVIIIDGYVCLDGQDKAGLGKYLYDQLIIKKPIIGIAKTNFYGIPSEYKIYRGTSKHPLYVTCINISIDTAKTWVQKLQGQYRIPDIVKKTDILSRETDTEQ